MEFITRNSFSSNWITLVILACFVLLSIAKQLNTAKFIDFLFIFNNKKYVLLHQKNRSISNLFSTLLILIQVLSVSLLIYFLMVSFTVTTGTEHPVLFVKIACIYFFILLGKLLIEKITGILFSIEPIIDEYVFYKISYRNFIGVVLLPANMLLAYTFQPTKIALGILMGTIVVFNVIVLFLMYRKKEKLIINNLFYFILYLCALEIAPYFIVYKMFT